MKPSKSYPAKPAICESCGKDLKGLVPIDATDIQCYDCYNLKYTRKDQRK